MGHGVGLCLTEPPSITPSDETVLIPGMVLAIEPGLAIEGGMLIHEEDIVITQDGCELLTRRAPVELPMVAERAS
jgi:Xaa-Pro dipeptidase